LTPRSGGPEGVADKATKYNHVQAVPDVPRSLETPLWIIEPRVFFNLCSIPIKLHSIGQRNTMLAAVDDIFGEIVFELHVTYYGYINLARQSEYMCVANALSGFSIRGTQCILQYDQIP